jgi:hypothetical protein
MCGVPFLDGLDEVQSRHQWFPCRRSDTHLGRSCEPTCDPSFARHGRWSLNGSHGAPCPISTTTVLRRKCERTLLEHSTALQVECEKNQLTQLISAHGVQERSYFIQQRHNPSLKTRRDPRTKFLGFTSRQWPFLYVLVGNWIFALAFFLAFKFVWHWVPAEWNTPGDKIALVFQCAAFALLPGVVAICIVAAQRLDPKMWVGQTAKPNSALDINTRFILNTFEHPHTAVLITKTFSNCPFPNFFEERERQMATAGYARVSSIGQASTFNSRSSRLRQGLQREAFRCGPLAGQHSNSAWSSSGTATPCWSLRSTRLARSTSDLYRIVSELTEKGVSFKVVK